MSLTNGTSDHVKLKKTKTDTLSSGLANEFSDLFQCAIPMGMGETDGERSEAGVDPLIRDRYFALAGIYAPLGKVQSRYVCLGL